MDNLKYSVKTQQFGKKRYEIFPKESEKESISLEVHDPKHGVSHLVQMTKSQEQSVFFQSNKPNNERKLESVQQQQVKTVKFNRGTNRKQNNQVVKNKNSNHMISNTAKVAILFDHTQLNIKQENNSMKKSVIADLQTLKYVLLNNEERLSNLVNSVNTLYRNTIQLYNNHERKLRQLVNYRCYDIAKLFKTAMLELRKKDEDLKQVDARANLLLNTLKDTKETLRIVKIKQQCIQALQKQHSILKQEHLKTENKNKKKEQEHNPEIENKSKVSLRKQSKQSKYKQEDQNKKQQAIFKKLPTFSENCMDNYFSVSPLKQSIEVNRSGQEIGSSTSFVIFSSKSIELKQQAKKSPFQANQLFLISNTMPTTGPKLIGDPFKQVQYSFRKRAQNGQSYKNQAQMSCSYTLNHNNIKNQSKLTNFKTRQNSNSSKFEKIKANLQKAIQKLPNNQAWHDNLNCLRRTNGTYIFDEQGNAVICSKQDYNRLLKQQTISKPKA